MQTRNMKVDGWNEGQNVVATNLTDKERDNIVPVFVNGTMCVGVNGNARNKSF